LIEKLGTSLRYIPTTIIRRSLANNITMSKKLQPSIKNHVYNNDRHAGSAAAPGATKPKRKKNNKHASIIPDIIEERRKSSSTGEVKVYRYKKGKYLGKGGFARCYAMTNMSDGRVYAGKVVSKSSLVKSKAKAKLIAEIKIHKHLNHRHIVKFEHFFEDKVNVYILLEICTNSTMMELVKKRKKLSEPEARYYTLQMIDALRYLHRHNVIHRDMKLGNLFLNKDMEIRVGDLGLSAKLNDQSERKKTICGTPNYIAPEIIAGKSHSFEVDVWSLGVIMFTMLFGKPPFETKDVKSTYRKIRHGDYSFPSHSAHVSKEARSLVASILQLNPEKRPTLDEMLCHEWFTGYSAVIPKTLPQSALTTEPNFYDLECQNLGMANFRGSGSNGSNNKLRLSKDSGGRRPLGQLSGNKSSKSSTKLNGGNNLDKETLGSNVENKSKQSNEKIVKKSNKEGKTQRPSSARYGTRLKLASDDKNKKQLFSSRPQTAGSSSGKRATKVSQKQAWSDARKLSTPTEVSPSNYGEVPVKKSSDNNNQDNKIDSNNKKKSSSSSNHKTKSKSGSTIQSLGTLKHMHLHLTRSFAMASGEKTMPEDFEDMLCKETEAMSILQAPSVWVTRWVDYTSKYGLGYMLANGSIGVYFNDSTKIILSSNGQNFEYMERTSARAAKMAALKGLASPEAQRASHTLKDFPTSLTKKVTLLKHFKSYLKGQDENRNDLPCKDEVDSLKAGSGDENMIFVKKWVRTRHAILFRMSNRTVQVAFFDKTEIILASQAKLVTYVDKSRKRTTYSLYEITRSKRSEIQKRLKYTKDILQQLISGKRSSS
jgi:polo-like kinase 1